ncbi:hypothetical protein V5F44_20250 [Xanthobacter sp. V2C-8]|uniref:hypothetical protein n=1 Tax=Xanthobacter albus TaxID=3119929 RepID=UPI00372B1B02
MTQERKIPKRVQRILDACQGGASLCKQTAMTHLGTTQERWFLHPSNREVSIISAREAAALLIPSCDGLFGAESSQTWRA